MAWVLALVAIVFAGDRLLSALLDVALVRSEFRYSRLYRGGVDADLLIVGDSRGIHSFYAPDITERTGLRTFNLSYSGLSAEIAEAMLLDYLDHNRPPRMVIIEVTNTNVRGGIISEIRTYAGLSPRLWALYARQKPEEAKIGELFHLLRFNSGFYLEALHYVRHSDQDLIARATMPLALRKSPPPYWLLPDPKGLAALDRMVRMLRSRGVEVRLVLAPFCPPPQSADMVAATVARNTGLRVWNYAGAIRDQDDFLDRVHVNEAGSRVLLSMMLRDGVFAEPPRSAAAMPPP